MTEVTPGRFIVFDGCDAAGKTTQLKLLHSALLDKGIPAIMTREPGGTVFGEKLRDVFLTEVESADPLAQIFTMMAMREEHMQKKIIPNLAAGTWVLCDRFIDCSRVYQGYWPGYNPVTKFQNLRYVQLIDKYFVDILGFYKDLPFCFPSHNFIFDLPVDEALARLVKRTDATNALDRRPREFHEYVGNCYREDICKNYANRTLIDASPSIKKVHNNIMRHVFQNSAF